MGKVCGYPVVEQSDLQQSAQESNNPFEYKGERCFTLRRTRVFRVFASLQDRSSGLDQADSLPTPNHRIDLEEVSSLLDNHYTLYLYCIAQ